MAKASPRSGRRQGSYPAPADLEAETALLGAAFLSSTAVELLVTEVPPDAFYKPAHQTIRFAIGELYDPAAQRQHIDPVTVAAKLRELDKLDDVGGKRALLEIQADTASAANARHYADIVIRQWRRRLVAERAQAMHEAALAGTDWHGALERLTEIATKNGAVKRASTIQWADIPAVLQDDRPAEEPCYLTTVDNRALLYPGRIHFMFSEPTIGKTWIALAAVTEVLHLGGTASYLDFEDTDRTIVKRLLALGAQPADLSERFIYANPTGPMGPAELLELTHNVERTNPDLVVIDGVAEALARDGRDENSNAEVYGWLEKVPRAIARAGAAVLMLDHVVKSRETRGRYPRGAGGKLASVDGAAYEVILQRAFSRSRAGELKLRIAKDRHGGVGPIGGTAAFAHIEPEAAGERVLIRLTPPTEPEKGEEWKPTVIMEKISRELESSDLPLNVSTLKNLVGTKPAIFREALERLVQENYVARRSHGGSKLHTSVRPYRSGVPDGEEPPPEDDQGDFFGPDYDPMGNGPEDA